MKAPVFVVLMAIVSLAAQSSENSPPMPFVDWGACPFELCSYGDMKAVRAVRATREPPRVISGRGDDQGMQTAFVVAAGETVTAMTGVVFYTRPGRATVDKRMDVSVDSRQFPSIRRKITVAAGDTVYLLSYHGESQYLGWYNGDLVRLDLSNFDRRLADQPSPCGSNCDGAILDRGESQWWVRIRNAKGQIGWTDRTADLTPWIHGG